MAMRMTDSSIMVPASRKRPAVADEDDGNDDTGGDCVCSGCCVRVILTAGAVLRELELTESVLVCGAVMLTAGRLVELEDIEFVACGEVDALAVVGEIGGAVGGT